VALLLLGFGVATAAALRSDSTWSAGDPPASTEPPAHCHEAAAP
jgi:hypothetical protein